MDLATAALLARTPNAWCKLNLRSERVCICFRFQILHEYPCTLVFYYANQRGVALLGHVARANVLHFAFRKDPVQLMSDINDFFYYILFMGDDLAF